MEGMEVVVFDVDGVLSDASRRQHFLEAPSRDWIAFFDACGEDPLLEDVAALLDVVDRRFGIVLLTGRPLRVRDRTIAWLERHRLRWDLLVMRPDDDYRSASEFKRDAVADLRVRSLSPVLAFEDDPRTVEVLRSEGIPCVYIHSGYYDRP